DALRRTLSAFPASTRIVLVRPPVYVTALPQPGSDAARENDGCRAAFAALARERPATALVDWAVERAENLDATNYFDRTHYRAPLARRLEADIAQALKAAPGNAS